MKAEISRRSLMKTSALGSLALASSAFTLPFSQMVRAAEAPVEEKAVWSSCTVNCGSRCLLRLHVKDDTVYWVESDTTGDDVYGNHQVRACLRGRSIRRRMNHPDRLKYPMKRVGKRGEGKFRQASRGCSCCRCRLHRPFRRDGRPGTGDSSGAGRCGI